MRLYKITEKDVARVLKKPEADWTDGGGRKREKLLKSSRNLLQFRKNRRWVRVVTPLDDAEFVKSVFVRRERKGGQT